MLSLWCVLAKRAEDCIYVCLCASCLLGKLAWTGAELQRKKCHEITFHRNQADDHRHAEIGAETSSYSERKKKRYLEVLTWPQYPEEVI